MIFTTSWRKSARPLFMPGQALGPRLRGDDEQGGVPHANFRNEVLVLLATPAGFEPAATRLEGECSIQLSYGVPDGRA